MFPSDSHTEVLMPGASECDCTWRQDSSKMIKLKWVIRVGPNPALTGVFLRRETYTKARNTQRKWPSASQEERPQEKPTLAIPGSWTSSPQTRRKYISVL